MEADVKRRYGAVDSASLIPIPAETLKDIVIHWRDRDDEGYLTKFTNLLASNKFQYDDIWFHRLVTNCLEMELDFSSNESKYVCPVLTACCRLLKSTFFKSNSHYADDLYQKIKLFAQFFEKEFCAEDVIVIELFLEVYCCVKECPYINFVDKKYEAILSTVLWKFRSIANGPDDIPVKRVMLQLINFLLEENWKSNALFIIKTDLNDFVNAYPQCLQSCGDYAFQLSYTEAVLRLPQYFTRENIGQMLHCTDTVVASFMLIDEKEFDKTCRIFLNTFNSRAAQAPTNCNNIYSFPCIALQFGKVPLKKTNEDISYFWVDINQGSSSISFYCDISTNYEDELVVPLFIQSTDIEYVSCTKLNENLCLKVKLLKPCVKYSLSNYDFFKSLDGSSAALIFEEQVELVCISQALNSIGLNLQESSSQEFTSENEVIAETPSVVKASTINFSVKPYVSNDENEVAVSTTVSQYGTLSVEPHKGDITPELEFRLHEGNNENLNSQGVSKASVAEKLVIFDSQETVPYDDQNDVNDYPDKLEKMPSCKDSVEITHSMEKYLDEQNKRICKASTSVDMVTCHGISNLKKRKSVNNIGPMHKEFMESSSDEVTETYSKRKCKFTARRKNRRPSSKVAKTDPMSSASDVTPDSEHFNRKSESTGLSSSSQNDHAVALSAKIKDRGKMLGNNNNNHTSEIIRKSTKDDNPDRNKKSPTRLFSLMAEKNVTDASTQCTPTTIGSDQNNLDCYPQSCEKSTMCSPGVISGPSSPVRPTRNAELPRMTGDSNGLLYIDQSSALKPMNTFRRRLAFETPPQQPPSTIDGMDTESTIQDFGKIISTKFSEKLAELSAKQTARIKRIVSEFQKLLEDQLKTSMEINEQMKLHLDILLTEFQINLRLKSNLQNQHEDSNQLILDGYETFLQNLNAAETEILTSTKKAENGLLSDVSQAKSELLDTVLR